MARSLTRARSLAAALAAVALLGPALRAGDDLTARVRLQAADLLAAEERYREAAEAYAGARDGAKGETRWLADFGLVRSLLRIAEFRRARAEAEEVVAARPSHAPALALYGDALWASGLFDEAEARYRQAVSLDREEARARNGMAKSLGARNRLAEALEHSRAAVALAPREAEFHHTLGFLLERSRRYDEAAASMRNYLNLLPNKDRSEKAMWTRQQVRFLESFGDRTPLDVDPKLDAMVHTIPFTLVGQKVLVRGRINGRDADMVVDTGAEMTVVTKTFAERVGIEPLVYTLTAGVGSAGLRGLQLGRMNELQVGTLKVRNVPTLIKNPPLRGLPIEERESFSPLGLGFSVRIDYARRVLFISRALPEQNYDVELPMRVHRLAMVRGMVNGDASIPFVIDTGGEVISMSRATAESLELKPVRHIPVRVFGASGWDPDAFLLTGINLAFDRISMPNSAVVVLNLDAPSVLLGFEVGGIVGHRFLSRYQVAIDLDRSILGLTN